MKRYAAIAMILLLVVLLPAMAAAAAVGTVTQMTGRADVTGPDRVVRPLRVGDAVAQGDIVRTKSGAKVEITFEDGSVLRLAPVTRVEISEFVSTPTETRGLMSLLRGKIQSIVNKTGLFGMGRQNQYEVHTATAVCGVRGTNFWVSYQGGVSNMVFKTGAGYTYSKSRPGEVQNVNAGQAAVVVSADQAPVVMPATEEEIQEHENDTDPTVTGGGGGGGDEGGEPQAFVGGDDDDGEDPLTTPEPEPLPEVYVPPTVEGDGGETFTLFSSVVDLGGGLSATLSGQVGDTTNLGGTTLAGDHFDGAVDSFGGTMDNGAAFQGTLGGQTGSWEALFATIWQNGPQVGYLYSALTDPAYAGGDTINAGGPVRREAKAGSFAGGALSEAMDDVSSIGEWTASIPLIPSYSGMLVDSATMDGITVNVPTPAGTRLLSVWQNSELSQSYDPFLFEEVPPSLVYGAIGCCSYYLGTVNHRDDGAGHAAEGGLLGTADDPTGFDMDRIFYMDMEQMGEIGRMYRVVYDSDGGTYDAFGAGTATLDPLAVSGFWGGEGGGIPIDGYSLYSPDAYTTDPLSGIEFIPVAEDWGIIGGIYAPWDGAANFTGIGTYFSPYGHSMPDPGASYLWRSPVMAWGTDAATQNPGYGGEYRGYTAGYWTTAGLESGTLSGRGAIVYLNDGHTAGGVAEANINGFFYENVGGVPEQGITVAGMEETGSGGMFKAEGRWSPTRSAEVPNPESAVLSDGSFDGIVDGSYLANDQAVSNVDGESAFILDNDTGRALPWGVYSMHFGMTYDRAALQTALEQGSTLSAMLGGGVALGETEADDGYWWGDISWRWSSDAGTIAGSFARGKYITENEIGTFSGRSIWGLWGPADELGYGGALAQSVGVYDAEENLFFSYLGSPDEPILVSRTAWGEGDLVAEPSGAMGGMMAGGQSLWDTAGPVPVLLLGTHEGFGPGEASVWQTGAGSLDPRRFQNTTYEADPGAYVVTLAGIESGDDLAAGAVGLYIAPSGRAGFLLGAAAADRVHPLEGTVNPEIGMFIMEGGLSRRYVTDVGVAPADLWDSLHSEETVNDFFASDDSYLQDRICSRAILGSHMTGTFGGATLQSADGLGQSRLQAIVDPDGRALNWGTYSATLYGTLGTTPTGNAWTATIGGGAGFRQFDFDPYYLTTDPLTLTDTGFWMADVAGTVDEDSGSFEGSYDGYFLTRTMMGGPGIVAAGIGYGFAGDLLGTYDADAGTWEAVNLATWYGEALDLSGRLPHHGKGLHFVEMDGDAYIESAGKLEGDIGLIARYDASDQFEKFDYLAMGMFQQGDDGDVTTPEGRVLWTEFDLWPVEDGMPLYPYFAFWEENLANDVEDAVYPHDCWYGCPNLGPLYPYAQGFAGGYWYDGAWDGEMVMVHLDPDTRTGTLLTTMDGGLFDGVFETMYAFECDDDPEALRRAGLWRVSGDLVPVRIDGIPESWQTLYPSEDYGWGVYVKQSTDNYLGFTGTVDGSPVTAWSDDGSKTVFVTYKAFERPLEEAIGTCDSHRSLPWGIYRFKFFSEGMAGQVPEFAGAGADAVVPWSGVIGGEVAMGQIGDRKEYGYWLTTVDGNWYAPAEGEATGKIDGEIRHDPAAGAYAYYLTPLTWGTIRGDLTGQYSNEAVGGWIAESVGYYNAADEGLSYSTSWGNSDYWDGDGPYVESFYQFDDVSRRVHVAGHEAGIFGAVGNDVLAIGTHRYEGGYDADQPALWLTSLSRDPYDFTQAADEVVEGFTIGRWGADGSISGQAALVRVDGEGGWQLHTSGNLAGRHYDDGGPVGGAWLVDQGTLSIGGFADVVAPVPGSFDAAYGSGAGDILTDAMTVSQPESAEGQPLWVSLHTYQGTSGGYDVGDDTWQMRFQADLPGPGGTVTEFVNVDQGYAWNGDSGTKTRVEAQGGGAWIDLDDALVGVSGGELKGIFDPNNAAWIAVGAWAHMDVATFMNMVVDDSATLAKLNIPAVEIGKATLSGNDSNLYVTMHDVTFFARNSGGVPSIWASPSVTGTYTNVPTAGVSSVPLSDLGQASNLTANFDVTQWSAGGNWSADVNDGAGTVGGHDLSFSGAATGQDHGDTTFDGTAAGVTGPPPPPPPTGG